MESPEEPSGVSFTTMKSLIHYFYTGDYKSLNDPKDARMLLRCADYFMLNVSSEKRHSALNEH